MQRDAATVRDGKKDYSDSRIYQATGAWDNMHKWEAVGPEGLGRDLFYDVKVYDVIQGTPVHIRDVNVTGLDSRAVKGLVAQLTGGQIIVARESTNSRVKAHKGTEKSRTDATWRFD